MWVEIDPPGFLRIYNDMHASARMWVRAGPIAPTPLVAVPWNLKQLEPHARWYGVCNAVSVAHASCQLRIAAVDADAFRDAEVNAIAHEIERYAATHPRSKDSLEGICHWWLENSSMSVPPGTVQHAIDVLVKRGVLVEETLPDGGVIYACTGPTQRKDPGSDG